MNNAEEAYVYSYQIIRMFKLRSGFDEWWNKIPAESQIEILNLINYILIHKPKSCVISE